ncbi:MAG: hypothetical protein ABIN24_14525, partial [Dyadobacter sp.]
MQTDQFDDEFRKKLLDIHPVTNEDEVDRIHNYVSSNSNTAPFFPWSKSLFYGLATALIITSLTCNYIQDRTNKQLFSSLDSLKTHITYLDSQSSEKLTVRVDTVYINRYIEKYHLPDTRLESIDSEQAYVKAWELINNNTASGEFSKKASAAVTDSEKVAGSETEDLPQKRIDSKNLSDLKINNSTYSNNLLENNSVANRYSENSLSDNKGQKYNDSGQPARTWLLSELSRIGKINPGLITLKLPKLRQLQKLTQPANEKPRYYAQSIKSILKKMEYYAGGSLEAGNNQFGASLLGELRITPKWSFQTGFRWMQVSGDGYFSAEQYSQRTGRDFRALYAPYVAQNVDLLNIEQNYQLLQIPLTVAYHYQMLPNWTIRFGLGTDLSIYAQ